MKTRWTIAVILTFLLFTGNDVAVAQEPALKFDNVLGIESTLKLRELKTLTKPKKHKEHEVVVKILEAGSKINIIGEKGYVVFFYYLKVNKLESEWIQIPGTDYDRLYYNWEPTRFSFKFEDSKTGKSQVWHKTFN